MSEPVVLPTKPRSRRLRFGLRAGLGAIAVVAVLLGVLDFWFRAPYRAEQRAAEALARLGGNVLLVDEAPGWLQNPVGRYLFDMRVAAVVDLGHSRVTDADLVHLLAFRHVGAINLSDTEVSNAGLGTLRKFVGERFIDLSRTRVTDVSSLFAGTWNVQPSGLKLSGNRLKSGAILYSRPAWCPLQELDLSGTGIDDRTIETLPEGLDSLSKLDLSGTDLTDTGLFTLIRFEGLTNLDVSNTKVTPEGVARLKAYWKGRWPLTIATKRTGPPIIFTYGKLP